MWYWELNWGEVRQDLVIGSCPITTDDIDRIRGETAVTALLSLQDGACHSEFGIDYAEHVRHGADSGLVLVNSPMRDFDPGDHRIRLPDAVRALQRLLADGHRVYVHCTAGMNRSPLTVLGYLVFVEGRAPEEALRLIRRGRPEAVPYMEAYENCRRDLVEQNREAIEARAWDLSRTNPANSQKDNWLRAEGEVIRTLLSAKCPDRKSEVGVIFRRTDSV